MATASFIKSLTHHLARHITSELYNYMYTIITEYTYAHSIMLR